MIQNNDVYRNPYVILSYRQGIVRVNLTAFIDCFAINSQYETCIGSTKEKNLWKALESF